MHLISKAKLCSGPRGGRRNSGRSRPTRNQTLRKHGSSHL